MHVLAVVMVPSDAVARSIETLMPKAVNVGADGKPKPQKLNPWRSFSKRKARI